MRKKHKVEGPERLHPPAETDMALLESGVFIRQARPPPLYSPYIVEAQPTKTRAMVS